MFDQNNIFEVKQTILQGKYQIVKHLGSGQYGQVFKCKKVKEDKNNIQFVAIKIMNKTFYEQDVEEYIRLFREVNCMKKFKHANICQIYEFVEDTQYYYIVEEYCNQNNLVTLLHEYGKDPEYRSQCNYFLEEDAIQYMCQIINAFREIHSNQSDNTIIIHRDIKPENILVSLANDQLILKVGDFGFAREKKPNEQLSTILGSPLSQAPEISLGYQYDERADIYSLGVLFYLMLFGQFPFRADDQNLNYQEKAQQVAENCKRCKLKFDWKGVKISERTQQLVSQMLAYYPGKRISFPKLFSHPYFTNKQSQQAIQIENLKNFQKNPIINKVQVMVMTSSQSFQMNFMGDLYYSLDNVDFQSDRWLIDNLYNQSNHSNETKYQNNSDQKENTDQIYQQQIQKQQEEEEQQQEQLKEQQEQELKEQQSEEALYQKQQKQQQSMDSSETLDRQQSGQQQQQDLQIDDQQSQKNNLENSEEQKQKEDEKQQDLQSIYKSNYIQDSLKIPDQQQNKKSKFSTISYYCPLNLKNYQISLNSYTQQINKLQALTTQQFRECNIFLLIINFFDDQDNSIKLLEEWIQITQEIQSDFQQTIAILVIKDNFDVQNVNHKQNYTNLQSFLKQTKFQYHEIEKSKFYRDFEFLFVSLLKKTNLEKKNNNSTKINKTNPIFSHRNCTC